MSEHKTSENCIFCNIYLHEKEKIIWETNNTFAIHDINLRTSQGHIQVNSKDCIKNINHQKKSHLPMLTEIKDCIPAIKEKFFPHNTIRTGFHIPPCYSITHLHMHIIAEPISSFFNDYFLFWMNLRSLDKVIKNVE